MLSRTSFRRFLAPEITVLRVALSAAFVYAVVAAWAWIISDRMIFLPPPPSYRETPDVLRLPTADGERIAAVYLSNPAATYTLLVSHGNGEDLGYVLPSLPPMRELGFSVFAFDKFRNVDKIGRVRCPVLIMHGEADEIVPLWHGRRLFERAPEPKMFVSVPGAHHNDFMWVAGARYATALRDFEALLRGG